MPAFPGEVRSVKLTGVLTLLGVALVLIALTAGGYAAGAWRSRHREHELQLKLEASHEELQVARAEVARLTAVDGLTGLPANDAFQQFLEREWRRALRELTPLSLILIDLDHFKHYNQQMGYETGDECLKRVGVTVGEVAGRPGDLVARYRAEKFIIALARTDGDGVLSLATKVRGAIEALELPHPGSPVADHVTASIGVATAVPSRGATWQEIELVAAAERALAEAKRLGRNRIARAEFIAG
jgi:diguanylate cyclase (GGDEF)-like protein